MPINGQYSEVRPNMAQSTRHESNNARGNIGKLTQFLLSAMLGVDTVFHAIDNTKPASQ